MAVLQWWYSLLENIEGAGKEGEGSGEVDVDVDVDVGEVVKL